MNFLEEREQLELMDKLFDLGVSGIALNAHGANLRFDGTASFGKFRLLESKCRRPGAHRG
ncbi:MAG: hypothetical protein LBP80_12355 [Treponema sp.]|nr:hypothetical protein [Treponema sp.]